jgi:class 3 adenylate cyclase/tetratricopeptide (TPR) repeat protein
MAACIACGVENDGDARFCKGCGSQLDEAAAREQRKTATLVFCDLVGSTRLGESSDPEAVKQLLARYFERMKRIVESHGGAVEKFIGDAVVAVFGVPVAHEDDALRALRAAIEMRDALPEVGVEGRIGVNSGEIVTSGYGTLVTGDAANVAARLEQAAGAGEVLVGAETVALAGSAIEVEELKPLTVRGKAEPVRAFRLLAVGEARARADGPRFVGRDAELALLNEAWDRVLRTGGCELVTILGEPGVGKSRLVKEFTVCVGAPIVTGRCLSYGEGITYFPAVEVVRQLGLKPVDPSVGAVLASLLGESEAPTSSSEIAWAFRKLLEQAAPLVVLFDDLQWGEETFLDLVQETERRAVAPILLVCLARSELTVSRSDWSIALRLAPLTPQEVNELIPAAFSVTLQERIARAAGGNPLFLTEMVAMAAEADGEVAVPGTLKALLVARLDQLEGADRDVLERGAVEGELFHRGPVQALAGKPVTSQLASLTRKDLIRPDSGLLPAEDAFRFCHLLIRDAAYEALPKAARAELHERFADWLDEHGEDLVERDEIVGYHLQQAHRYRLELGGADDEETDSLGVRAAARLTNAARRAATSGDHHAVANLLRRALELGVRDPHDRVRLQVELGSSLYQIGRSSASGEMLAEASDAAARLGARDVAALALVNHFWARFADPELDLESVEAGCRQAVGTFAELGDDRGLALAGRVLGLALSRLGRRSEAVDALDQALVHADASGDLATRRLVITSLLRVVYRGPTPVGEAIARFEQLLDAGRPDRVQDAVVKSYLGGLCAMAARFDEGLELIRESSLVLDELNHLIYSNNKRELAAQAKELAGDRPGAEQEWLSRWSSYQELGDGSDRFAVESAYALAQFYCDEGRWDDAESFASLFRDTPLATRHAAWAATMRRAVEARLTAHDGRAADALKLAEDALTGAETLGVPNDEAGVWLALAEVRRAAGLGVEADAAVTAAIELYEQKGNIAAAARVRAALDESVTLT